LKPSGCAPRRHASTAGALHDAIDARATRDEAIVDELYFTSAV
jgi:hypothetical protein